MKIKRRQMGLAYTVLGQYCSNNFYQGIFYAGVMTQSESTAEAIEAIFEQIRRLQNEPVSEQEMKDTKDRFLNSLVFEYDSRASVLNERKIGRASCRERVRISGGAGVLQQNVESEKVPGAARARRRCGNVRG